MMKIFLVIMLLETLASSPAELKVTVNNIQGGRGNVVVEIYDNSKDFFKKAIITKTVKASKASLNFSFDIPEGIYAIAVYQDINENKKLDKGLFSIPKEPFGLSNNYRPSFSAPTFDDCKFNVADGTIITIGLK